MLFNSYIFLFLYLPFVFCGFFIIGRKNRQLATIWLFVASVLFYGWWNPLYVGLLLASIIFNYSIGITLSKFNAAGSTSSSRWILRLGIAVDLCVLGYFKYANFFLSNISDSFGLGWNLESLVLPLGISFFTFTQIAFLVDAYRGEVTETSFIHYGLFVTYFPHLIAGPVLHHKEMMPQFSEPLTYRIQWENLSVGLTIFIIGLFKKVVFADGIAPFATPVFAAAAHGATLTFIEAWGGTLAYTLQLYFDFSGYSDMAIGISRLFGIKLPLNFNSPYKSVNIIDFWRRWHITLSRFLRDYLYFALGGNRKGTVRRYLNLMATMVLGGLWHGAGWTFVIWGALHGFYLVVNHGWQLLRKAMGREAQHGKIGQFAAIALTFLAVVIGWVFFRAQDVHAATQLLLGMSGGNGLTLPAGVAPASITRVLAQWGIHFGDLAAFANVAGGCNAMFAWISVLLVIVWFGPNTQEMMAGFKPALEKVRDCSRIQWTPNLFWLAMAVCIFIYSIAEMGKVSEFLYFQF